MEKSLESPTDSPKRRRRVPPREWKVLRTISVVSISGRRAATLSRISLAALLVNVTAQISYGLRRPVSIVYAILLVMVLVLPLPAQARIRRLFSLSFTASACSALRDDRSINLHPLQVHSPYTSDSHSDFISALHIPAHDNSQAINIRSFRVYSSDGKILTFDFLFH